MRSTARNVLLVVENNGYPGDFRVRREALALRDAGYRVFVACPRDGNQPWTETRDDIAIYRFPAPIGGRGLIGYVLEFTYATLAIFALSIWIALRFRVNVIHAANPPDSLFVIGMIFKPFGTRFVFDHHDLAPETYLSRFRRPREDIVYRTLRLLERFSYAVSDVVISTNESYRRVAIERGRKNPDSVFVVRNGPPLSYGAFDALPSVAGLPKQRIAYVGTIGPQDGLDYLLRAVHEIVHTMKREDFVAIVIGDGDALPEARRLAKDLDIEPFVLFTGRLPETEARSYLALADVCVQPDPMSPLNDKSTMNKLMEYMALGKPTVAFDLSETRVSAQGAAIYVPPNDEAEFARQVCRLLDNPEEGRRMGDIGRSRVRQELAWEHSIPQLLRAYAALKL